MNHRRGANHQRHISGTDAAGEPRNKLITMNRAFRAESALQAWTTAHRAGSADLTDGIPEESANTSDQLVLQR
jgi:hypothetical protein